jgi:hypothetical protein
VDLRGGTGHVRAASQTPLCTNPTSVGVVPFNVSTYAEGLDCHLAYGNSVHAQCAVTIQRLVFTNRVLQVAMMQRHVFRSPFLVRDRPHILRVQLLRLDIKACLGEIECCLVTRIMWSTLASFAMLEISCTVGPSRQSAKTLNVSGISAMLFVNANFPPAATTHSGYVRFKALIRRVAPMYE